MYSPDFVLCPRANEKAFPGNGVGGAPLGDKSSSGASDFVAPFVKLSLVVVIEPAAAVASVCSIAKNKKLSLQKFRFMFVVSTSGNGL